jgi:hypothetical protein
VCAERFASGRISDRKFAITPHQTGLPVRRRKPCGGHAGFCALRFLPVVDFRFANDAFIAADIRFLNSSCSEGAFVFAALIAAQRFLSSPFTYVSIFGYSAVPLSSKNSYNGFVCSATELTIPSAILSLIPTNGYGAVGVKGVSLQVAGVIENRLSVAGTPGLDVGVFTLFTSTSAIVTAQ